MAKPKSVELVKGTTCGQKKSGGGGVTKNKPKSNTVKKNNVVCMLEKSKGTLKDMIREANSLTEKKSTKNGKTQQVKKSKSESNAAAKQVKATSQGVVANPKKDLKKKPSNDKDKKQNGQKQAPTKKTGTDSKKSGQEAKKIQQDAKKSKPEVKKGSQELKKPVAPIQKKQDADKPKPSDKASKNGSNATVKQGNSLKGTTSKIKAALKSTKSVNSTAVKSVGSVNGKKVGPIKNGNSKNSIKSKGHIVKNGNKVVSTMATTPNVTTNKKGNKQADKHAAGDGPVSTKSKTKKLPKGVSPKAFPEDLFESTFAKENVTKLVTAAKKLSSDVQKKKPSLFDDNLTFMLQFSMYKVPKTKPHNSSLLLEHTIVNDDTDICIITKDLVRGRKVDYEPTVAHFEKLLAEKGIKKNVTVLSLNQIYNEYKTFEMKKKLMNTYDKFLADCRIVRHVNSFLGKMFAKRCKSCVPIDIEAKDLQEEFANVLRRVIYHVPNTGVLISVPVGTLGMSTEEFVENIIHVVKLMGVKIPGGSDNIHTIHIHPCANVPVSVPVYINLSRGDVKVPEVKTEKMIKMEKLKNKADKLLEKFELDLSGVLRSKKRKPEDESASVDKVASKKIKKETENVIAREVNGKIKVAAKVQPNELLEETLNTTMENDNSSDEESSLVSNDLSVDDSIDDDGSDDFSNDSDDNDQGLSGSDDEDTNDDTDDDSDD